MKGVRRVGGITLLPVGAGLLVARCCCLEFWWPLFSSTDPSTKSLAMLLLLLRGLTVFQGGETGSRAVAGASALCRGGSESPDLASEGSAGSSSAEAESSEEVPSDSYPDLSPPLPRSPVLSEACSSSPWACKQQSFIFGSGYNHAGYHAKLTICWTPRRVSIEHAFRHDKAKLEMATFGHTDSF